MEIILILREMCSQIAADMWILIPVLFTLLSLGVMLWSLSSYLSNTFPSQKIPQAIRLLASIIFFVWSSGYLLYYLALKYDGANTTELLLRSATSSVQMFLGGVDSNVSDNLHETGHMTLASYLAFVSFWAVGCTVAFVSLLILSRFRVFFSLWWFAVRSQLLEYHRLYIFFGINEESILLAKDIINSEKGINNGKYHIIFVEKSLKSQDDEENNGWDSMVNLFTHRRKTFNTVTDLKAFLAIMNGDFKAENDNPQDIFNALGLSFVRKIIKNINESDYSEIHIFCLNDKERRENIFAAMGLQQDITLLDCAQHVKTTIHCLARYNSVNRSIEDMNTISGIDIKIVDPSHLSIELLKHNVTHHPVNYVEIDTDYNIGTVKSTFTSLIIGFGETGKDALRYLYEYGAFVDCRSRKNYTIRSPFSCHVVDGQMASLKSAFISASPSMFNGNSKGLIQFHDINYNSPEFYQQLLPELICKLNYIVVAAGDDEANMTLAVRILKSALREGRDFKKLRIYVRSYEPELLPYMEKIAKHYNEKETRIVIFGKKNDIYQYDNIVHDKFEEKGKRYYETYRSLRIDPDNDEGSWDDRRGVLTGSKRKKTYEDIPINERTKPSVANLQKLRRKETQDKSNALHEGTKVRILTEVMCLMTIGNKVFPNFKDVDPEKSAHSIRDDKNEYDGLFDDEKKLLSNLAKLEHIRWNASHEAMGYSFLPINRLPERCCDETLMLHNCLCPWESLDYETSQVSYIKDYKSFDYGVVETTIYEKMKSICYYCRNSN